MPPGTILAVLRHPDVWWVAAAPGRPHGGPGLVASSSVPARPRSRLPPVQDGDGVRRRGRHGPRRRRPHHLPPLVSHLAGVEGVNELDDTDRPASIRVVRVSVPVRRPHRSAHGTEDRRESILVRWRSADGADGWGECPALAGGGYVVETPDQAWSALTGRLLVGLGSHGHRAGMLTPVDPTVPAASAALADAALDSRLRAEGIRLADHLARQTDALVRPAVATTAVLADVGRDVEAVVDRAVAAIEAGASMVKVKIAPGHDIAVLTGVRRPCRAGPGRRRRERVAGRRRSPRRRRCRRPRLSGTAATSGSVMERPRGGPWHLGDADRPGRVAPVGSRCRSGGTGRGARRGVGQAGPPGRSGRRGARGPPVCRVGSRRLRRWHVRTRHRPGDRKCRGVTLVLLAADRPGSERPVLRHRRVRADRREWSGDLVVPDGPGCGRIPDEDVLARFALADVELAVPGVSRTATKRRGGPRG